MSKKKKIYIIFFFVCLLYFSHCALREEFFLQKALSKEEPFCLIHSYSVRSTQSTILPNGKEAGISLNIIWADDSQYVLYFSDKKWKLIGSANANKLTQHFAEAESHFCFDPENT